MKPLPTLRQLQFFVALARRQSFSKAAEDCLVSQSTLSSAIMELEGLLDARLVDRSTRRVALTQAGRQVAEQAAAIISAAEDLARIASARLPLEGAFHLGVIPTIAPFLLPAATAALSRLYPRLDLFLREDLTAQLAERLVSGQLDAAILAFPVDLPGIEHEEVGDDPFYVAAPRGHPLLKQKAVRTEDLGEASLLLLEDGHCMRDHALDACRLQGRSIGAYGATSLLTLTQMVRSGLGATLLPKMAVDAGLAESTGLEVAPLAPPAPGRRIGVAWRKGSARADEACLIAAAVRQAMASAPR
jgi:LysR family hydrogen peroxide-inducible transcriptional activator